MTIPIELIDQSLLKEFYKSTPMKVSLGQRLLNTVVFYRATLDQNTNLDNTFKSVVSLDALEGIFANEIDITDAISYLNGALTTLRKITDKSQPVNPQIESFGWKQEVIGEFLIDKENKLISYFCVPVELLSYRLNTLADKKIILSKRLDLKLDSTGLFFIDEPSVRMPLGSGPKNELIEVLSVGYFLNTNEIANSLNQEGLNPRAAVKRHIQELNKKFMLCLNQPDKLIVGEQNLGYRINPIYDVFFE